MSIEPVKDKNNNLIQEQEWMCLRCFRPNFTYETSDNQCTYGCGYTNEPLKIPLSYDWICPKCNQKNFTVMFTPCQCRECHYRPTTEELYPK